MLPAQNRLRNARDFSAAVRAGHRVGSSTVVIHLRRVDDPVAPVRVGLVVGRSVGPAVIRNQVKRRLRHAVRDRMATVPAGTTLVVRALPAAARAGGPALAADLDQALQRALRSDRGQNGRAPRRGRRPGGPGAVKDGARMKEAP